MSQPASHVIRRPLAGGTSGKDKWAAEPLDRSLRDRLGSVCVRIRRYLMLEGAAWMVGFMLTAACVQFALDYGTRGLRWSMRAALLALIIMLGIRLVLRRLVAPYRLRPDLSDAANLLERRYPQLSSVLISAVRFSDGQVGPPEINSPELVESVIGRAGREARGIDFSAVLDPRRARRSLTALFVMLAGGVLTVAAWPNGTSLWFSRNILLQDIPWPKRTTLVVELTDGILLGARGDDLVVDAYAEGVQPREVQILFKTASGVRGRESMVTVGSEGAYRYRYTFKTAQEDFVFHLEGGDDRSREFTARLLDRPRVIESQIHVVPPAYSRIAPFSLGDGQRSLEVLLGTEIIIRARANKTLVEAKLMAGTEMIATAQAEGDYQVARVTPSETHTYHFALLDEAGLTNKNPVRFFVRVAGDDPPRARLKMPGVGDLVTPAAELPIELEYSDTYGLRSAELIYLISKEGVLEQPIPLSGFPSVASAPRGGRQPSKVFATNLSWPVSAAGVEPGGQLTLYARAEDLNTFSGPGVARSQDRTLRVVTADEFLAELRRREQELRIDFERQVDQQEQLRGRLLTMLGQSRAGDSGAEWVVQLAKLERRQRTLASSVNVVRQRFEAILSELRINGLGTRDQEERLAHGIVTPLTNLARRNLVVAADTIRQWADTGSSEEASLVDRQQIDILTQMRAALANMIQWEGYHEVVDMLNDILRIQKELHDETERTMLQEAEDVFSD